jgi:hypothetical protein
MIVMWCTGSKLARVHAISHALLRAVSRTANKDNKHMIICRRQFKRPAVFGTLLLISLLVVYQLVLDFEPGIASCTYTYLITPVLP